MIAFDTDILAYADGIVNHPNDVAKVGRAQALLTSLRAQKLIFPAQALGELFRLIAKTNGGDAAAARIKSLIGDALVAPTLAATLDAAFDLAARHRLQIWDAIIVSAAVHAGAHWLLSEDMRSGFVWRGLTIVNPLAGDPAVLLEQLVP